MEGSGSEGRLGVGGAGRGIEEMAPCRPGPPRPNQDREKVAVWQLACR